MAGPLRIEIAGTLCHITSRDNTREKIYVDDDDRELIDSPVPWMK